MRKITLITAARSEYGIQRRLIKHLATDDSISFSLIVSGTHLSTKHGLTVREIEADGIPIAARVDLGIDTTSDVPTIMARALTGFSKALQGCAPDLVIMLGDRYEMLAAALACTILNIPIAHLHGGETTVGATDEVFRHAITKASCLHFTSCEEYRNRVIQLGESPDRVFNVGSLGVENILKYQLLSRDELSQELDVKFRKINILSTFHPVTFQRGQGLNQVSEVLAAFDALQDTSIFITRPNADSEGDAIAHELEKFAKSHANAYLFSSLGSLRYLSLAKHVDAVVGNSSSGIIEIPSLKTATVNIGDRQQGRIHADSVVNCKASAHDILDAIEKATSEQFKALVQQVRNPYEKSGTEAEIIRIVKAAPLTCHKKFYDLPISQVDRRSNRA